MRVNDVVLFEVDWDVGRREVDQVQFPSSTINDPDIKKAIKEVARQTKTPVGEVKKAVEEKLSKLEEMATSSPILYETINKNAAEQAIFELFWKANIKPKGAPEFDNVTFKKLINRLRVDYDEFFPLRSYIDKRKLVTPVIRVLDDPNDKWYKQIETAAATPNGEFLFNKDFMQSLLNYAHMKGLKVNGDKFKSNGGQFPDAYAYIEFIIMHEFMHYSNDDFYYQRIIPNANPKIINWVGDFRTNYQLVKNGFTPLPLGLYNDKINYDRQDEYVEMYDIVKDEFERLKPEDQKLLEKILDQLGDDHGPGNDQGQNAPMPQDQDGDGDEGDGDCPTCNGTGKAPDGDKEGQGKGKGKGKGSQGETGDQEGDGGSGDHGDGSGGDEAGGERDGPGGDEGTCPSCGGSGKKGNQISPDDLDQNAKANGKKTQTGEGKPGDGEGDEPGDGDSPFSDIRGKSGKPGKGKGTPKEIDYSKINPQFNWKQLVDRFIKSGLSQTEPTYSRPHRRSVTTVDIARQRGAGAIKPAEKPLDLNDAKIMFIIDNSGSMNWIIDQIMATATKLLKMPAFRKTTILVAKFSGDSQLYKVHVAGNKAGKVEKAGEMPKTWDMKADKLLATHYGGGTEFTNKIVTQTQEAMRLGYNVITFSDSDILYGGNLENLIQVIKTAPKQAFIVFDTSSSYIEFRKKTGISTPNFTFFKDER